MPDLAKSGTQKPLSKGTLPAGGAGQGCAHGDVSPHSCDLPLALSSQPGGWRAVGPVPFPPCRLDRRVVSLKGVSRLAHLKVGENIPAGQSLGWTESLVSWPLLPRKANSAAVVPSDKNNCLVENPTTDLLWGPSLPQAVCSQPLNLLQLIWQRLTLFPYAILEERQEVNEGYVTGSPPCQGPPALLFLWRKLFFHALLG